LAVFKIDFDLQYADVNVTLIPDSICLNNQVAFVDSSRNIDVMTWDFGDGTTYVGRNPNKHYTDTGLYTITIIGVDTLCFSSDTATLTLHVFNSFAQAAFTADYDTCGLPFSVLLSNQSSGAISYLWNFGDGTTSTKATPSKTYGKAGTYTIYLAAKDSVCDNWDTTYTTVFFHNSGGFVDFTLAYDYCVDWQNVIVKPVNGNNYQIFSWDFGDGTVTTVKFPTHTYSQPGSYSIVLTAIDTICNLSTIASQTIDVLEYKPIADEIFPNVFTPNGDGVNDTWQVLGELSSLQFEDFSLEVYNRWGTKVLTNYDATYRWQGNYLDTDLAEGVYFWLVRYTDICGNKNEKHGEVHLMR
jgi:gliding motility-associated-like protein